MKTRPERDLQQTAQYNNSIPCEWSKSYAGETGRPLAMRLCQQRRNIEESRVKNQN
jgi:hypothetical protein